VTNFRTKKHLSNRKAFDKKPFYNAVDGTKPTNRQPVDNWCRISSINKMIQNDSQIPPAHFLQSSLLNLGWHLYFNYASALA